MSNQRILFLTVGSGHLDDLENTLITPLLKSIKYGDFASFVLLPSQKTLKNAEIIQNRLGESLVEIYPLPEDNMEENADKCTDFFNSIFQKKLKTYAPENIEVDLTRGTKVMSSAVFMAGIRNLIFQYRYITSQHRNNEGQVISGEEKITKFDASVCLFLTQIDQIKTFIKSFNFSAVSQSLSDKKKTPKKYERAVRYICQCADFYSYWHRLDYAKALEFFPNWGDSIPLNELKELGLDSFCVNEKIKNWITLLATPWKNKEVAPSREECLSKADQAFEIAIDLLANAQRQIEMGNFEDAIVRSYRILELLGQICLFKQGYDSSMIDPNDELVRLFINQSNRTNRLFPQESGYYCFSRSTCAEFIQKIGRNKSNQMLKDFGELLINSMRKDNKECIMSDTERNVSILIHGFQIQQSKDKNVLLDNLKKIQRLLSSLDKNLYDKYEAVAFAINKLKEI